MRGLLAPTLLMAGLLGVPARAAQQGTMADARVVAPFLDDRTIGVARFDLSRVDTDALFRWMADMVKGAEKELDRMRKPFGAELSQLKKLGVKDIYLVLSLADLPFDPPLLVLPGVPQGAEKTLGETHLLANLEFERQGKTVLAGSEQTLKRLKGLKPTVRPELSRALTAAGPGAVQVALLPTPILRQALTEAVPTLPHALGGLPTKTVADGFVWAAASIDAPPKASLRLTVKASDEPAAGVLRGMVIKALAALGKLREIREAYPGFDRLASALTPKVKGDRLTLALSQEELSALLTPLVQKMRQAAAIAEATNNLKQFGLALHGYHDANGHFPPAAFTDARKRRLLSWRVHLLPYLEQQELYKQFKLDEPWDSPHNKKLIGKMPKVFISRAADPKLAAAGKTVYLAPIGLNTIFPGTATVKITEVTDGTSNTVLLVEGDDSRAVIWTKPDDLEFNPKIPAKGLRNHRGKGYLLLFADGSVHFLSSSVTPEVLRTIFTRNGGEVVNLP
jgi:Protein of unknown function (DUF1559)